MLNNKDKKPLRLKQNKVNCENIVKYVRKNSPDIYGKEIDSKFYKWINYNQFSDKSTTIESRYKKGKIDKKYINDYICGSKKSVKELDKNIHKGYKTYLIHNNGIRPFLVAIKDNIAKIFKVSKDVAVSSLFWTDVKDYYYTDLINEYKCKKIFIPKGVEIYNKIFYIKEFNGNSILLDIGDKYIYIGDKIYEFKPTDEILKYYSPVGNNDVPYPVTIGTENIYFMLDNSYVPKKYFEGLNEKQLMDAYAYYYGYKGNEKLSKYAKKMKGFLIVKI